MNKFSNEHLAIEQIQKKYKIEPVNKIIYSKAKKKLAKIRTDRD